MKSLFKLEINQTPEEEEMQLAIAAYSANPRFDSACSGRMSISAGQADQIILAIKAILNVSRE